MKKRDWILIGRVLGLALVCFLARVCMPDTKDKIVQITVDGELFAEYSLEENTTVDIRGTNTLQIQDGSAKMIYADCPDQICVHQHRISQNGQSIICLPNKTVVTIVSDKSSDIDAVSN